MPGYQAIGDMLDTVAARFPDKDAFCIGERRITYQDLARLSDTMAKALSRSGVRKGDRVAVWMKNCIEWLITFYGAAKMGAVLVPLSTRFKASEARHILAQSGASVLIFNKAFSGVDFISLFDEVAPGLGRGAQSTILPALDKLIVVGSGIQDGTGLIEFWRFLEQGLQAAGNGPGETGRHIGATDPFLIQYTSGTTGFPKGVVLTQGNFTQTGYEVGLRQELSPEDRFFSPAPYFHVSGTMHALVAPISHGCTVYSVEKYELEAVMDSICRNQCTAYHGFNFFKDYFAHREQFAGRYDVSVLKRAWTTGTAVDMANIGRLGIKVCSLYGLSETTGCSTICSPSQPEAQRTRTVGKPLPGIEVCIQDRQGSGALLGPSEEGEICIRGWNLMDGYFANPDETRIAFDASGWFHSGDLGSMDADGNLRYHGRLKDIIRVGGENLSPLEVENLLRRHPEIMEACVVGVPDARLGEVCMAFIQLRPGRLVAKDDIVVFCRKNIASYKVPRHIHFVTEFPVTGNNKIRRAELREIARRTLNV